MATMHPARHRPAADGQRPAESPRRSVVACSRTSRPPSSSRTRSAPVRASSPPRGRSSCAPASTPAARPRTSSSSTSPAPDKIWWGDVNRPISEAHYDRLRARLVAYCAEKDLYAQDLLIGPDPRHQRRLRVYTETAWASIFARNLFRRPTRGGPRQASSPTSRSSASPRSRPIPRPKGTRTETAILLHLERMEILIVGTEYAGEIKKSRLHGHELPDARRGRAADALARSTSAKAGDSVGLLRALRHRQDDPVRGPRARLIGDDEHGWGTDGLFNFEGGCYAKTIRLSPMYEPDIFQTTRRFGTVLENVDLDPETRELDLDSERFTENTRGAYPLHFIGNADATGMTGQPTDRDPVDRRCLRRPAAHRAADPRPGGLPLHQRLHGQAGRHRGRRQGAEGHVLGLLRGAVHAAPPGRVRRDAHRAPGARRTPRSGS